MYRSSLLYTIHSIILIIQLCVVLLHNNHCLASRQLGLDCCMHWSDEEKFADGGGLSLDSTAWQVCLTIVSEED